MLGLAAIVTADCVGDGRLLVMATDRLDSPTRVEVRWIDAQANPGPAALTTGPLTEIWRVAARTAYALPAISARDAWMATLVRTTDAAMASAPWPTASGVMPPTVNGAVDLVDRLPPTSP